MTIIKQSNQAQKDRNLNDISQTLTKVKNNSQSIWDTFFINGKQAADDFMNEIKQLAKNQK